MQYSWFDHALTLGMSSYVAAATAACFVPFSILLWRRRIRSPGEDQPPVVGCRRIGLQGESNLSDQYEKPTPSVSADVGRVKSLWVYPIKSGGGVELVQARLISSGLQYDRMFCLAQLRSPFPVTASMSESEASSHTWHFVTQRQNPRLALLELDIWVPDPSSISYSPDLPEVRSSGVLVVRYPSEPEYSGLRSIIYNIARDLGLHRPTKTFHIPILPSDQQLSTKFYAEEEVKIWRDSPRALDMSRHLPDDLAYSLGISNRLGLFRISPARPQERIILRNAPRQEVLGYQPTVQFGDAYPLNILNLASVQDVANHPDVRREIPRLSAVRFRGNIICAGPKPYDEETWKKISIGDEEYHVACRCARCMLPNVDPQTASRTQEPAKAMRKFRAVDKGAGSNACLGMQLVSARVGGTIQVGDTITVHERGEHVYIKI